MEEFLILLQKIVEVIDPILTIIIMFWAIWEFVINRGITLYFACKTEYAKKVENFKKGIDT